MTTDLTQYKTWRKARKSTDGSGCVEVCTDVVGTVAVRDSKLGADSPVLVFTRHEFDCFMDGVLNGEF